MNTVFLLATLLSASLFNGDAFLQSPSPAITVVHCGNSHLHGVQEWRDRALGSQGVPTDLPILPFPFPDIILQGERKQLNLYEQRFHLLFRDVVENHSGMVGMGLLAGQGMATTVPLCEVESFTNLGADEDWVDRGDGLGNGAIIVTIRAVGRASIQEVVQQEPYIAARVEEVFDEDVAAFDASLGVSAALAGKIENLMASLASLEHKLREAEGGKEESREGIEEQGSEATDRRLINAQLESLFAKDSVEGVDMESTAGETAGDDDDDDDDEADEADEDEDEMMEGENDKETLDRVARFQAAFESAKEADVYGDPRPNSATEDLPPTKPSDTRRTLAARTPRDLAAISWAAFCTGDEVDGEADDEAEQVQRDVVKIQALCTESVLQRLQLAATMLEAERKKLQAQLALVGIKKIMDEEP